MKFKPYNLVRVISFGLIITIIPLSILFSKKQYISEEENRTLADFPQLSFQSYLSRDYMNGLSKYLSDHFIYRENIISFKNDTERLIHKNEINGVLRLGENLVEIFRNPDQNQKNLNIQFINEFSKSHKNTYFCLAPTAQNYFCDKLPYYAYYYNERDYINSCYNNLKKATSIDITSQMRNGAYLYYRTDHHWTENGAYRAYTELAKSFDFQPIEKSQFKISVKSGNFKGTLYSKTLDNSVKADDIIKYTLKSGEPKTQITDQDGNVINNSIYYPSRLNEKDKYSYYLGANKGVINVVNLTKTDGPSLLVIKDSYANSLIPFLSNHFSKVTVVDLRYADIESLQKIDTAEYQKNLILYNVIGFSNEKTLAKLKFIK